MGREGDKQKHENVQIEEWVCGATQKCNMIFEQPIVSF